ncbi:AMP-binding protein [Azospirillum sp. RWY-5-1]|uniref:AMP-binding protein n=1 Tax=Azospirillum oleiclasticum TaxID=2735135 RepID=A0ABX2TBF8_9PROT|nr:AMP-binding protein [Azospirillum oleiclasticum]NYZ13411.1 AMP-binding protein [Azospirillum oleiclasticum]NYZ20572.1 AMP-binding protein [Azospirillum oleiclasticum]
MSDLALVLATAAAKAPTATAVVDGTLRLDYARLNRLARRTAAGLARLGLRSGDRLVTLLPIRWEAVVLHWACQIGGFAIVPLDTDESPATLRTLLAEVEPAAVAVDAASAALLDASAIGGAYRLAIDATGGGADGATPFPTLLEAGEIGQAGGLGAAVSALVYTAGTTDAGKGVLRSQAAEWQATRAHVAESGYAAGERTLGAVPLCHPIGIRALLAMALVAGTYVCLRRFDPAEAVHLIEREGVTALYLPPPLLDAVLAEADAADAALAGLRRIGVVGAPAPERLLAEIGRRAGGAALANHYGTVEVSVAALRRDPAAKPGSVGRPLRDQRIRIVSTGATGATGAEEDLPAGAEGELLIRLGGSAFAGYWRRPEAEAAALMGDWFRSGDTGYRDEDGELFVTGRVRDLIEATDGTLVPPAAVEAVLRRHGAVRDAVVAAVPGCRGERRLIAFLRLDHTIELATLDRVCREAGVPRPGEYVIVNDIPRSRFGTLRRRDLLERSYRTDLTALSDR